MNQVRKTLVGAGLSLTLLLGMASTTLANGHRTANEPFGLVCVSEMAQLHGGLGRHHREMNHPESLGSHLQMMRERGCEMEMSE